MGVTEDYLKEKLFPHTGHIKFILGILDDNISQKDVDELLIYIKNKHYVRSLPRQLHSYKDYYLLMIDLYNVVNRHYVINFIKENLASVPKKILLDIIKEKESLITEMKTIINNEEKKKIFLNSSSRIKDKNFAIFYIMSVISNDKIELDSNFIKLTSDNYEVMKTNMPPSWCLLQKATYDNYILSYDIYVLLYGNQIYGVTFTKNTNYIEYIQDKYNTDLRCGMDSDDYNKLCEYVMSLKNMEYDANNKISEEKHLDKITMAELDYPKEETMVEPEPEIEPILQPQPYERNYITETEKKGVYTRFMEKWFNR